MTASRGVQDAEMRVKYAGLSSMGMLFTELAPQAQQKYHSEVLPVLMNLMVNEPLLKMQTQATSAVLNFISGMTTDDETDDKEEPIDAKELMKDYSKKLLENLVHLLRKGIQEKYEPLQTECLNVLSAVCAVILDDFSAYYNEFMPMMTEIL